ncbi:hypothetical protein A9P44_17210 [Paenibacillus polymyxa]|nr:hypothetical protein A9P44_17210 [Paenibacillus polymyxa]
MLTDTKSFLCGCLGNSGMWVVPRVICKRQSLVPVDVNRARDFLFYIEIGVSRKAHNKNYNDGGIR